MNFEEAVRKAEERGHRLKSEPPQSLSSLRRRTCETCGRSVLGNFSHAYGSALEYVCVEVEPRADGKP